MVAILMSLSFLLFMVFFCYFNSWFMIDCLVISLFLVLLSFSVNEGSVWVSEGLMVDGLSLSMVLLVFFLFMVMYLASSNVINKMLSIKSYNLCLLGLLLTLIMSFLVNNYIWFYILFEVSLIPTIFIIMGWGSQPERLQAGIYLMMYTLLFSLPLLVLLVYFWLDGSGSLMADPTLLKYSLYVNSFIGLLMGLFLMMAFLVKLPMFMVHLWLPKAHVEAPVAGSMVLAGVLLKLGGYGLIRVLTKFLGMTLGSTSLIMSLSLVGMIMIGKVCCRTNDLKLLVAYSSVLHMGFVICGVLSASVWGLNGALMMMISHGIGSSGLFCFVNMLYERTSTRSLIMNKGIISILPLFSLFMFLYSVVNISGPPSINLLSEINLIIGVFSYDELTMLLFPFGSFLGAVSVFYMFSNSQHGKSYLSVFGTMPVSLIEFQVTFLHLIPINFLILKSDFLFFYC